MLKEICFFLLIEGWVFFVERYVLVLFMYIHVLLKEICAFFVWNAICCVCIEGDFVFLLNEICCLFYERGVLFFV